MAKFIFRRLLLNRNDVVSILPWIAELYSTGKITKEERNVFVKMLQQIPNDEAEREFKEAINCLARICPCTQIRAIQSLMNGEEDTNNVHLG